MEWKIKIDNEPNLRILVKFVPQKRNVKFLGQYKPHNKEWETFCVLKKNASELFFNTRFFNYVYDSKWKDEPLNFDIDKIKKFIDEIYDSLKNRVKIYESLNENFNKIKNIEFKQD